MKIVSKFRDYYDSINPSSEPFWKRNTRAIELDITKKSELSIDQQKFCSKSFLHVMYPKVKNKLINDYCVVKVLGLCGKLYPIYEMRYENNFKVYLDIDKFINNYNELSYNKKVNYEQRLIFSNKNYIYYDNDFSKVLKPQQWEIEFQKKEYVNKLFIDLNTPVFILYKENFLNRKILLDVNPCLLDHNIQGAFNIYTLYQMIEQYLSNELVINTNKPDIMSDDIKRDKHGFYNMSFKNRGGKKKRGKKK